MLGQTAGLPIRSPSGGNFLERGFWGVGRLRFALVQDMELGRLPACRAKGLLNIVLPVLLKQFGVLAGLYVQSDHFG
jgi:hypothetical protein